MRRFRSLRTLLALGSLLSLLALAPWSCADDGDGDCADITCGAREYCDLGQCIPIDYPNYTANNACDPLRACRRTCSTDARCVAACEAARSPQCVDALDALATCERSGDRPCESGPYQQDCCFDEFCDAFPSHPNCGNVAPCSECIDECGDDDRCFVSCVTGEPACASCLEDAEQCVRDGGTAAVCEAPCVDAP